MLHPRNVQLFSGLRTAVSQKQQKTTVPHLIETVRKQAADPITEKDARVMVKDVPSAAERDVRTEETARITGRNVPLVMEKDARMEKEDHSAAMRDVRMQGTVRVVTEEIQEDVPKAEEVLAEIAETAARAAA